MKRKHIIVLCGFILLSVTSTACSVKSNNSTASKQSSKTVKISKSRPKKKANKRIKNNKDQIKKTDKKQQDNKDKTKSESQKTTNNQSSQQSTKQQVSNGQQQPSNQSQNQVNSNQQNQQTQQKTQGEINRERGYDPKGHPIMPGSDHAAGYNPDGTEDAWVKGQDEWLHRNGLINPDGSPTQKEKDMEAQNENDDFGLSIPDEPDPE